MLWDELLEEVILHITPLCSLLHILLKDGECVCRMSENCKSLILQDKCNIKIFLSPGLLIFKSRLYCSKEEDLFLLIRSFVPINCSSKHSSNNSSSWVIIVCAGVILKESTCLLRHSTTEKSG